MIFLLRTITLLKLGKGHCLGTFCAQRKSRKRFYNEYLPHSRIGILESQNITEIGALYKISTFI